MKFEGKYKCLTTHIITYTVLSAMNHTRQQYGQVVTTTHGEPLNMALLESHLITPSFQKQGPLG